MLVTIFREDKFKIEILKATMTLRVAKIERSEKNYEIENSVYIMIHKIYSIIILDLPIFAAFMIILAFKISILNFAPLKMVTSIYIYCK